MSSAQAVKQKNLVMQALWILRKRPMEFFSTVRGYLLFVVARAIRSVLPFDGDRVQLGENVRLQRNRSLQVEAPNAQIRIGDDAIIYERAELASYGDGEISIGAGSILGDVRIQSRLSVELGERCLTSWNVFIQDFDPHPVDPAGRGVQVREMVESFQPNFRKERPTSSSPFPSYEFASAPIRIGSDVWLGANVTILKGVTIGDGCTVAAGAVVVSGCYPARCVLAGNPAKVVKTLEES